VEVQDRDIILGQLKATVNKLQQLEMTNTNANYIYNIVSTNLDLALVVKILSNMKII